VSEEILSKLDALQAGQVSLQVELLSAIGQSNDAVHAALQSLSDKLQRLEANVGKLKDEQGSLRTEVLGAVRESNEATLAAIQALSVSLQETRQRLRSVS
jgi:hypothetical protein